jgi:plasmid stabilization system protein ParE
MKLKWTAPARKQLDRIYRFYEQRNVNVATSIFNEIIDESEQLINFPQMAAIEPILIDFKETYRSLIVRRHFKVVYRTTVDTIYIVAVFDCRQDSQKLRNNILKN